MCLVSCVKTTVDLSEHPDSVLAAELSRSNNKQRKLLLDSDALKILEAEVKPNEPDFLAVGTQWTRKLFQKFNQIKQSVQASTIVK